MPNPGSEPPKEDDSPRPRTSPNSLTDQMLSTRYLLLHSRGFSARSLLPRRTPQEQREFLASVIREATSIIENDNDNDFDEDDDDSADGEGNRGISRNSTNYGDTTQ